jgi:hypothetical protein
LHKLRSALVAPDREKLKGEVEVDDCYIGGPEEGKPGRHVTQYDIEAPPERQERSQADGEPVLRKRAGRVCMSVVPDASAETLLPWSKDPGPEDQALVSPQRGVQIRGLQK